MPQSGYDIAAITVEAEKYIAQTPEELEYNFKLAWVRSRQGSPLPHRGDDSFWQSTRQRLTNEVIKNEAAGSVTIATVATVVVHWLEASGINLTSVDFPISLFVALVAKSVMDELKARNIKNKQEDASKKPLK
jgi:hypothetical protein